MNLSKSILLVKGPFPGGGPIGSSIGKSAFRNHYASSKIRELSEEVDVLVQIARSEPHAAYSAVTQWIARKMELHFPHYVYHPRGSETSERGNPLPTLTGSHESRRIL